MYLAQITIQGKSQNGCYRLIADSLDEIRVWAKSVGKSGDELFIMRNGDKAANGRTIII